MFQYGEQESIYRETGADCPICQGFGSSGKDCHHAISGQAGAMLFWRHSRRTAHRQGHRFTTSDGIEGCWVDTGNHRDAKGEVLHQPRQLGVGKDALQGIFQSGNDKIRLRLQQVNT